MVRLAIANEKGHQKICLVSTDQYSFDLVRTSFSDRFGLVIYSKGVNAEVDLASAEAVSKSAQKRKPTNTKRTRAIWK